MRTIPCRVAMVDGQCSRRRGRVAGSEPAGRHQTVNLVTTASALARKIREIERHHSWHNAFFIAAIHGCSYSGPNWESELQAVEDALGMASNEKRKGK